MILRPLLASLLVLSSAAAAPANGSLREHASGIDVWSASSGAWVSPEVFFAAEIAALDGPTYGRTGDYPPYARVREWETLIDVLPDGRECPMVFFHARWRRLPDVLALDERLRNWGGCADVLKH